MPEFRSSLSRFTLPLIGGGRFCKYSRINVYSLRNAPLPHCIRVSAAWLAGILYEI